jgi:DNA-binding transcriptional regulator YiaG
MYWTSSNSVGVHAFEDAARLYIYLKLIPARSQSTRNDFHQRRFNKFVSHKDINATLKLNNFYPYGIHFTMSQTEAEKLMADVKAWADQKRGRRSEMARMLGVSRQLVTNWLAGRKMPTLEDGLKLQAFLKSSQGKARISENGA